MPCANAHSAPESERHTASVQKPLIPDSLHGLRRAPLRNHASPSYSDLAACHPVVGTDFRPRYDRHRRPAYFSTSLRLRDRHDNFYPKILRYVGISSPFGKWRRNRLSPTGYKQTSFSSLIPRSAATEPSSLTRPTAFAPLALRTDAWTSSTGDTAVNAPVRAAPDVLPRTMELTCVPPSGVQVGSAAQAAFPVANKIGRGVP